MGPIDTWWGVLTAASKAGFNMVHLCPPQVFSGDLGFNLLQPSSHPETFQLL